MNSSTSDRLTQEELDIQAELRAKARINKIALGIFLLILGIMLGYAWRMYHEQIAQPKDFVIPSNYEPIDMTKINHKLIGQISGYNLASMTYRPMVVQK